MINVFKTLKDRVQGKAPKGAKRSSDWPKIRAAYLKTHPECAVCESKRKLEVHHVLPFHAAPDQELNPENLVTLCENKMYGINCHLFIGHLGNYSRINAMLEIDVMMWHKKLKG